VERKGDTLYVAVQTPYAKEWLDHRLRKLVDATVERVEPGLVVEFVVVNPEGQRARDAPALSLFDATPQFAPSSDPPATREEQTDDKHLPGP
jgi:hypothetical protein